MRVSIKPRALQVSDVTITGNYIDNGGCSVNIVEKNRGAFQDVTVADNTLGSDARNEGCAVIAPSSTARGTAFRNNSSTDGASVSISRG